MSAFITAALKILAGPKGDLRCVDNAGRPSTLRKEWTAAQLQLWEENEGEAITGIDTMVHWRSYTGA
jgi:hypothetical protein